MNIIEKIRGSLANSPNQSLAHRMDHLIRVRDRALKIAGNYECDLEVLELACLLHDIVQPFDDKENHVKLSVARANSLLEGHSKRGRVLDVIKEHSTEHLTGQSSLEAKILFDADKLDGLGPIGIARVFLLMGQCGRTLSEAVEWYRKKIEVALAHLQTAEGKALASELVKETREFLDCIFVQGLQNKSQ